MCKHNIKDLRRGLSLFGFQNFLSKSFRLLLDDPPWLNCIASFISLVKRFNGCLRPHLVELLLELNMVWLIVILSILIDDQNFLFRGFSVFKKFVPLNLISEVNRGLLTQVFVYFVGFSDGFIVDLVQFWSIDMEH